MKHYLGLTLGSLYLYLPIIGETGLDYMHLHGIYKLSALRDSTRKIPKIQEFFAYWIYGINFKPIHNSSLWAWKGNNCYFAEDLLSGQQLGVWILHIIVGILLGKLENHIKGCPCEVNKRELTLDREQFYYLVYMFDKPVLRWHFSSKPDTCFQFIVSLRVKP